MTPLLDFLNHSFDPNVVCELDTFEKQGKKHEYLRLRAIKEIPIGEQLLISYGDWANLHLTMKYGFTLPNNPNNVVMINGKFFNSRNIVFEENPFK